MDDGHSLDYLSGAYLLREFKYSGGVLTARCVVVVGSMYRGLQVCAQRLIN